MFSMWYINSKISNYHYLQNISLVRVSFEGPIYSNKKEFVQSQGHFTFGTFQTTITIWKKENVLQYLDTLSNFVFIVLGSAKLKRNSWQLLDKK